jgi:hypothetical protein
VVGFPFSIVTNSRNSGDPTSGPLAKYPQTHLARGM